MPVTLVEPKEAVLLDQARIAAIKIENNPYMGTYWIEVFLVYGRMVADVWEQHADPNNGAIAQYYRIAPGENPHARPAFSGSDPSGSGSPLGKCDGCGAWDISKRSGPCSGEGCNGTVHPYDGFQRLAAAAPRGASNYDVIKNAVYDFLTTEEVPDPVTGEIRKLLAATE